MSIETRTETVRTWTCDRCRRSESARTTELEHRNNPPYPEGWTDQEGRDLCPACVASFQAWLGGVA
jgi:hypothetical protein